MNKLQVRGHIFYDTEKKFVDEAYDELCEKMESVGIDMSNMRLDIILKDENDEEIEELIV